MWLQWVTHQFETIAGEDREIDLQEFKTALNVKEASVHSRTGDPAFVEEKKPNSQDTVPHKEGKVPSGFPGIPPGLRPHFYAELQGVSVSDLGDFPSLLVARPPVIFRTMYKAGNQQLVKS